MSDVPPDRLSNPHPIDIIPPSPVASPADLAHLTFGTDVPFWKPRGADIWKQLGWRWVLFLPLIALLVVLTMLPWRVQYLQFLLIGGWKLVIIGIALYLGMIGKAVKGAVGLRKEPFCIHCGYDLTGLPDGHNCPECGRKFWIKVIDEYRRDPNWFIQRHRLGASVPPMDGAFAAGAVRRKKSRDGT